MNREGRESEDIERKKDKYEEKNEELKNEEDKKRTKTNMMMEELRAMTISVQQQEINNVKKKIM